jgi:phosphatidylethanolamine-binding protein (PEBP) family uncharacterized protein
MLAEIWETGQEKIPYMGPAPPEGLHRYVLLLFKQVCTCMIIPAASSLVGVSLHNFSDMICSSFLCQILSLLKPNSS